MDSELTNSSYFLDARQSLSRSSHQYSSSSQRPPWSIDTPRILENVIKQLEIELLRRLFDILPPICNYDSQSEIPITVPLFKLLFSILVLLVPHRKPEGANHPWHLQFT